jgi:hypothetical protein
MKNNEQDKLLKTQKKSNNNEISLVFRNQSSSDTILQINKSNLSTYKISDIIDLLLLKLNKAKSEFYIRFFFKGRPLKKEEKLKDLCKQIIKLRILIYFFIIYSFVKFRCYFIYVNEKRGKS